jgi:hypothetical protein
MGILCGDWQQCDSPGLSWGFSEIGDHSPDPAPPFGRDRSDVGAMLAYLSTLTLGEGRALARVAAWCLDGGDWEGLPTNRGGWLNPPTDDEIVSWHLAALDFALRYREGDCRLTEGLIWHAAYELASELAYDRGWCPHCPWEKHRADDDGSPSPFLEEPALLIRFSAYGAEMRLLAAHLLGGRTSAYPLSDERQRCPQTG